MEPISASIVALGSALNGVGQYFGAKEQSKAQLKAAKMGAKENKRKTLAELLNEAMNRSHDTEKDTRRSQSELSGARARALQDAAAGIRQSLGR